VLQCVAVCCSVCVSRPRARVCMSFVYARERSVCCSVLHCVAVCCSVCVTRPRARVYICLLCTPERKVCVAVCCSVLQCVAVCCSVCVSRPRARVCMSFVYARERSVCSGDGGLFSVLTLSRTPPSLKKQKTEHGDFTSVDGDCCNWFIGWYGACLGPQHWSPFFPFYSFFPALASSF